MQPAAVLERVHAINVDVELELLNPKYPGTMRRKLHEVVYHFIDYHDCYNTCLVSQAHCT